MQFLLGCRHGVSLVSANLSSADEGPTQYRAGCIYLALSTLACLICKLLGDALILSSYPRI